MLLTSIVRYSCVCDACRLGNGQRLSWASMILGKHTEEEAVDRGWRMQETAGRLVRK
jgi:hypothetical protein